MNFVIKLHFIFYLLVKEKHSYKSEKRVSVLVITVSPINGKKRILNFMNIILHTPASNLKKKYRDIFWMLHFDILRVKRGYLVFCAHDI